MFLCWIYVRLAIGRFFFALTAPWKITKSCAKKKSTCRQLSCWIEPQLSDCGITCPKSQWDNNSLQKCIIYPLDSRMHPYNSQLYPSGWPIDLCGPTNPFEPRDFAPGVSPPGWKCSPSSDKDDCPCSPWRLLSSPRLRRSKIRKDVRDDSIQKSVKAGFKFRNKNRLPRVAYFSLADDTEYPWISYRAALIRATLNQKGKNAASWS